MSNSVISNGGRSLALSVGNYDGIYNGHYRRVHNSLDGSDSNKGLQSGSSRPSIYSTSSDNLFTSDESRRNIWSLALRLSVQEWKYMGEEDGNDGVTLVEATDRITALLLVRFLAIAATFKHINSVNENNDYSNDDDDGCPIFANLATSTICRTLLLQTNENKKSTTTPNRQSYECDSCTAWLSRVVTDAVIQQMRLYVKRILRAYKKVPFHNYQHAYHVTVSANKLLDLMLTSSSSDTITGYSSKSYGYSEQRQHVYPTFGLRSDPLALFGLVFAALIHDVEHTGVTNRQMVLEDDVLALLYNDQSVHEHRSLRLAFGELLKDRYNELRTALFPRPEEDYRFFRLLVIDIVLATDISSPERAQLSKSKWKEAFGDYYSASHSDNRRMSMSSTISMPRINKQGSTIAANSYNRRGSNASVNSAMSDVTTDSYALIQKQRRVDQHNARHLQMRRLSNPDEFHKTDDADGKYGSRPNGARRYSNESYVSDFGNDSIAMQREARNNKNGRQRLSSLDSADWSYGSDFANDSVALRRQNGRQNTHQSDNDSVSNLGSMHESMHSRPVRRNSTGTKSNDDSRLQNSQDNGSFQASTNTLHSNAADSVPLAQRRQAGQANTRYRRRRSTGETADDNAEHTGSGLATNNDGRPANGTNEADEQQQQYVYEYDEDSLSITPPSSEDEFDGVVITGVTLSSTVESQQQEQKRQQSQYSALTYHGRVQGRQPRSSSMGVTNPSQYLNSAGGLRNEYDESMPVSGSVVTKSGASGLLNGTRPGTGSSIRHRIQSRRASTGNMRRRMSTGNVPVKFGPLRGTINEDEAGNENNDSGSLRSSPFKKRLGIRRSMDLGGAQIELYSRQSSIGHVSQYTEADYDILDYDEPDEMKMSALVELLLKVADVAHCMQSWCTWNRWSSNMYNELRGAHSDNRGHDPSLNWNENQLSIMEHYVLPLAGKLYEVGVFGDVLGSTFAEVVEDNIDDWLVKGNDLSRELADARKEKDDVMEKKGGMYFM